MQDETQSICFFFKFLKVLLSDAALSDRITYNNFRKHTYKGLFDLFH